MSPPPPDPIIYPIRSDVRIYRRNGKIVIFDPSADAYYQIASDALKILQYLSEQIKLSDFVSRLNARGIHCSNEEVSRVVVFCQQNGLLVPRTGEVAAKRKKILEMKKKTWFLRFCSAYLFFKLPPLRPQRFYSVIAPYVSWLCSRPVVLSLLIPSLFGYVLMVREASAVRAAFVDSLSWAGLVKYMLAIVVLKIIHESAHSLAAMHFGCRVRAIGIGFMVFFPRLFTDTTDAWRLSRFQRLLIDGAGILSELIVGGLAVIFWCYAPPGPWRGTAFYIFTVSVISTLLVNGNPCIRYDGYYILTDIMGIPNLMHRSTEYVKQWWHHYLLRLGPAPADEHGLFLIVFGICAFIYRIFLYTGIILIIYHKFTKVVALGMMVLELYSILIYPFWREIQTIRLLSKRSASHASVILLGVIVGFVSLIFFVPMGWDVEMYGEMSVTGRELVVVDESGYLASALPSYPRSVKKGEVLCQLHAPGIDWSLQKMRYEKAADALNRQYVAIDDKDFSMVRVYDEKLRSDAVAEEELKRRKKSLSIVAGSSGVLLPYQSDELSAAGFLQRGQIIGEILHGEQIVDCYVRDTDVGKISVGDNAEVRVRDRIGTFPAEVISIDKLPGTLTPSAMLQPYGGPISVYPGSGGMSVKSVETLYKVTLRPNASADVDFGRVVHVSIPHRERFWDRVKRYLMSAFRREF